jgi:hypothetical protein
VLWVSCGLWGWKIGGQIPGPSMGFGMPCGGGIVLLVLVGDRFVCLEFVCLFVRSFDERARVVQVEIVLDLYMHVSI